MIPFSKFNFGFASAETEGARSPELLLRGFFDPAGYVDELRYGTKFLCLGYKGSGKSAIAEHLRLTAESDPLLFVNVLYLSDFPYSDFRKILSTDNAPEATYPTSWALLLLLALLNSFAQDVGALESQDETFTASIEVLQLLDLLPMTDLRKPTLTTSRKSFKVSIPKFTEFGMETSESDDGAVVPFIVDRLRTLVSRFHTDSTHLIILDGLDDILTSSAIQYDALAALIFESQRINDALQRSDVQAKVIVLCRTDLFERLPGTNKNKVRQDSAIELDWYHDPRYPEESHLIRMLQQRAELSDPDVTDIVYQYLSNVGWANPRKFVLDYTRHTPRDAVQLLSHIQRFSKVKGDLPRAAILSGARSYSMNYLIAEIRDELVGYATETEIQAVIELIATLQLRQFTFDELWALMGPSHAMGPADMARVLKAMFDCSAIGNFTDQGPASGYTFKYRNRNSTLRLDETIVVHRGLWSALNLDRA